MSLSANLVKPPLGIPTERNAAMAHFIISYDLHSQRTYPPVWQLLESWGATRLLESLWVVTIATTSGDLRDALLRVVDSDDSVAVIELKPNSQWSTRGARQAGVDWLTQNIRRY
jgi:hypothetical protein